MFSITLQGQTIQGTDTVCYLTNVPYIYNVPLAGSQGLNFQVHGPVLFEVDNLISNPTDTAQIAIIWAQPPLGNPNAEIVFSYMNPLGQQGFDTFMVYIAPQPNPVIISNINQMCIKHSDLYDCYMVCLNEPILFTVGDTLGSSFIWDTDNASLILDGNNGDSVWVSWGVTGETDLTVTSISSYGCHASESICIEVLTNPLSVISTPPNPAVPQIEGDTLYYCGNQPVEFSGVLSSSPPSSPIVNYHWDFGDGSIASGPQYPQVTHLYTAGTYPVQLIVQNMCGCSDTTFLVVVISALLAPDIFCIGSVCAQDTANYQTSFQCNGISTPYNWYIEPTGSGTIIQPVVQPTNSSSVQVVWGNGTQGVGYLYLSVDSACANACPFPAYAAIPVIPDTLTIIGSDLVCRNSMNLYSLPALPVSYSWWIDPSITGAYLNGSTSTNEVSLYVGNPVSVPIIPLHVQYHSLISACEQGCSGESVILIKHQPTFDITGPSEVCLNASVTVQGQPGCTWQILNEDGSILGTFNPGFGNSITFSPANYSSQLGTLPATITVTAANPSAYCNVASLEITVLPPPPPVDFALDTTQCVCGGSVYTYSTLSAPGCYLTWSVIDGTILSNNGYSIDVLWNPVFGGPPNYHIIVQNVMGASPFCPSQPDTFPINHCFPVPLGISGDSIVCINDTLTYCATASNLSVFNSYEWTIVPPNAGSIIGSDTSSCVYVQWNNTAQNAFLSVSGNSCNFYMGHTLPVQILGIPQLVLVPDTVCEQHNATFTVEEAGGGNLTGSEFTWVVGSNSPFSTPLPVTDYTFGQNGIYPLYFTAQDINGCNNTFLQDTFYVSVSNTPEAEIIKSGTIICDSSGLQINQTLTVVVNNTQDFTTLSYSWIPVSNNTNSITVSSMGLYGCYVTGTDSNGVSCTAFVQSGIIQGCNCLPNDTMTVPILNQSCNVVTFDSLSPAYPVLNNQVSWDFGDGTSQMSTPSQIVTHTYIQVGSFDVVVLYNVLDSLPCECVNGIPVCGADSTFTVADTIQVTIQALPYFSVRDTCISQVGYGAIISNQSQVMSGITVSYSWYVNGAFTTTGFSPPALASGDYLLTLQITLPNGQVCSTSDSVHIPQTLMTITIPRHVCEGNTVQFLSDITDGSFCCFSWDFTDGSGSNLDDPVKSYQPNWALTSNNYIDYFPTLTVINFTGCAMTRTDTITVYKNEISFSGSSSLFCKNDTGLLGINFTAPFPSGNAPYTYSWSLGNNHSDSTTNSYGITVLVTEGGNYTLMITDNWGCSQKSDYSLSSADVPHPAIYGETHYCDNPQSPPNLALYMYGPAGFQYSWTLATQGQATLSYIGLNTTGSLWTISSNVGQPRDYTVTAYIKDTLNGCIDSASVTVTVHPLPDMPYIVAENTCWNFPPVQLAVANPDPQLYYLWSDGSFGDSITVIHPGSYAVTALNDAGCLITSSFLAVNPPPDFGLFPAGCYEFGCECLGDTLTLISPYGEYDCINWLQSLPAPVLFQQNCQPPGQILPWSDSLHLILQPGIWEYSLEIVADSGCVYTSDPLYYTVASCEDTLCCEGNVAYFIQTHCDSLDNAGNPVYQFGVQFNYTGSASGGFFYTTAQGGWINNINTNQLQYGSNSISGYYTDIPPLDSVICVTFYITDTAATDSFCHQTVCGPLSPCNTVLPDCQIQWKTLSTTCLGQDGNGNWEYKIVLNVFYPGTSGSPFLMSSTQATLYNFNTNLLNAGWNTVAFYFTDFPPFTQYICFDLMVADTILGYCGDQYCVPLPNCIDDWCYFQLSALDIQCNNGTPNVWDYNLMFEFTPPVTGTVDIVSPFGFVYQNPYPQYVVSGVTDTAYFQFYDSLHVGFACFYVMVTDTATGNFCADSVCLELPSCNSLLKKEPGAKLTIAPNPNDGSFMAFYQYSERVENPELEILTAEGKSLKKIPLQGISGYIPIKLENASVGTYPVFLCGNGKRLAMQKVFIQR